MLKLAAVSPRSRQWGLYDCALVLKKNKQTKKKAKQGPFPDYLCYKMYPEWMEEKINWQIQTRFSGCS